MLNVAKGVIAGVVLTQAIGLWFTYTRHVIRTDDGLKVVAKLEGSFSDIYVDTRSWGFLDYARNGHIAKAMARDGLTKAQGSVNEVLDAAKEKVEEARRKFDEAREGLEKHQKATGEAAERE